MPECSVCGRDFPTQREIYLHEVNVHNKTATKARTSGNAGKSKGQRISTVAHRTDAGLACPKCGGVQFTTKRSFKQKAALGLASLAVKGSQVRCVTCGTVYKRG